MPGGQCSILAIKNLQTINNLPKTAKTRAAAVAQHPVSWGKSIK